MTQISSLAILFIVIILIISLCFNVVLFIYAKNKIGSFLTASEEASKIFTLIDTYRDHLETVYSLPTFYGDETLKSLLDHTRDLYDFLSLYEEVYSLTQPDLIKQLEEASKGLEEKNEEETPQKEG
jgi:hypothetical protein